MAAAALPAAIAAADKVKGLIPKNIPKVALQIGAGFLVLGGGLIVWRIYKKGQAEKRRNKEVSKVGAGTKEARAVELASIMHTAMYRTWSWWNKLVGDGTDEETLYNAAVAMNSEGIPFGLVSEKYRIVHEEDLWQDLQNELGAKIAVFQQALNQGFYSLDGTASVTTRRTTMVQGNGKQYRVEAGTLLGRYAGTISTQQGKPLFHLFLSDRGNEFQVPARNVSLS